MAGGNFYADAPFPRTAVLLADRRFVRRNFLAIYIQVFVYSSTKQIVRVHSVNRIACKRRDIDMKPSNGRFLVSEKALSDVSCQEGG